MDDKARRLDGCGGEKGGKGASRWLYGESDVKPVLAVRIVGLRRRRSEQNTMEAEKDTTVVGLRLGLVKVLAAAMTMFGKRYDFGMRLPLYGAECADKPPSITIDCMRGEIFSNPCRIM